MVAARERDPILAADAEKSTIEQLETLLTTKRSPRVCLVGPQGESVYLPESVATLLARLVHELARGNAVTVVPIHAELTTQQAADLLNVSRPHLVKLLENGQIPFHRVGTHRRVFFRDLMEYKRQRSEKRREALAQMTQDAQEMGLYDLGDQE